MKDINVKAVLYRNKTYANRTHPIMIRITKNRKSTYESINHAVPRDAWDMYLARVFITRPRINAKTKESLPVKMYEYYKDLSSKAIVLSNANSINAEIDYRISEITLALEKMRANNEEMDVRRIKTKIAAKSDLDRYSNLLKLGEEISNNYLSSGNIGTHKRYKTVLKRLSQHINRTIFSFADLDLQFLTRYELHLKKEGLNVNSIHNQFKTIRAIYYRAMKEGLIDANKNPFKSFKLKTSRSAIKEKLSISDLKKIEALDLEKGSPLWHTRNYFIFSFNVAGIRVSDLMLLKWKHIDKNGRVNYNMQKTGGFKSLQLSPRALEILSNYKKSKQSPDDFLFPILPSGLDISKKLELHNQISARTTIINRNLKELATEAEIDVKLSTHIARHSFADIARQKTKDVHAIKNLLGHSSIAITERYLKSLDYESQDEALKDILNI